MAQHQRSNPFSAVENHSPQISKLLLAQQQTARVEELRQAKYQDILAANDKITLIRGWARFTSDRNVTITKKNGSTLDIAADRVLIATGAKPYIPFGQNSSTGALLFAKVGDETFILTFGQGYHLIDSAKIEMNFGLKTALNLLDVASIRSIDKSSFEQYPTQTRAQTGVATEVQYFGLDIERDLLRAITALQHFT